MFGNPFSVPEITLKVEDEEVAKVELRGEEVFIKILKLGFFVKLMFLKPFLTWKLFSKAKEAEFSVVVEYGKLKVKF